jgi:hypothetical protein
MLALAWLRRWYPRPSALVSGATGPRDHASHRGKIGRNCDGQCIRFWTVQIHGCFNPATSCNRSMNLPSHHNNMSWKFRNRGAVPGAKHFCSPNQYLPRRSRRTRITRSGPFVDVSDSRRIIKKQTISNECKYLSSRFRKH